MTLKGFSSYVVASGLKKYNNLDLSVIVSDVPCVSSAVFTQNAIVGEPIKIGREHIKNNQLQALVINAKYSNVQTGEKGYNNSMQICQKVAEKCNIAVDLVLPSSTGIIGRQLPISKVLQALEPLPSALTFPLDSHSVAKAIMTTDTVPKYVEVKVGGATLIGIAKGVGMIEPNMATMLVYFLTDAVISQSEINSILKRVVDKTFNCVSVDSDMSTSDTVVLMANGLSNCHVNIKEFEGALFRVALDLTKKIITDAEGSTKILTVNIKGALNDQEAKKIGKSIINSPLVKTAIYKGDSNVGRFYMAIGKTPEVTIKPNDIKLYWGEDKQEIVDDEELHKYLKDNSELILTVDIGVANGVATVYGCDLTEEYIKINAYYTT